MIEPVCEPGNGVGVGAVKTGGGTPPDEPPPPPPHDVATTPKISTQTHAPQARMFTRPSPPSDARPTNRPFGLPDKPTFPAPNRRGSYPRAAR